MCRVVTAPGKGHDAPDIGRYRCAIEGGIGKDGPQTLVGVTHLLELHVADAVLGGQDSSRLEAAMAVGIETLGEQGLSRTHGIGRIGDDHVKTKCGLLNKLQAIGNHDLHPWILKGSLGMLR